MSPAPPSLSFSMRGVIHGKTSQFFYLVVLGGIFWEYLMATLLTHSVDADIFKEQNAVLPNPHT